MDIKALVDKTKSVVGKFKYAAVILLIGLVLIMLPERKAESKYTEEKTNPIQSDTLSELEEILQFVEGAGEVRVLLTHSKGAQTLYQINEDTSTDNDGHSTKTETVIVTDSQRNESGLVTQVNPPVYQGAIVVCQGGDIPAVRLAITQAVAKVAGIGSDCICVLKMK